MTEDNRPQTVFSPALALHLLTIALMAGAVAWSIAQLIGWWVALPIGIALTYVFSALAKKLIAPSGTVTRAERIGSGVGAIGILAVTVGLSYGSLYATLFAETSALANFAMTRLPVERAMEQSIANAQTVQNTFRDWSQHSQNMRDLEQNQGGSCPAKPASIALRGGIARWRDAEALTASTLFSEITSRVTALRRTVDAAKARAPTTFMELQEASKHWNGAIEMVESLARGAYIKGAKDSLARQLTAEISWPKETFKCGDTARDELIERALSALKQLEKSPTLQPLTPVIDLSNRQDIAGRAMIRSFNMILKIISFGFAGTFVDDSLMQEALAKGVINRETLSFGLSALLEISVLLTGALVAQRGGVVFPYQPVSALRDWEASARQFQRRWQRILAAIALFLSRSVVNLFFATPVQDGDRIGPDRSAISDPEDGIPDDPVFPERSIAWASALLPYWVPMHHGDYLLIPNIGRSAKALQAARALSFQGLATQLHFDAPFARLTESGGRQMHHLLPDARGRTYAIFKLALSFAQALRISCLEMEAETPRGQLRTVK